jgi:hypothetical protein
MSSSDPENSPDEIILVATIHDTALDRVTCLFLNAGIQLYGGGSRGAFGVMVERKHQALAKQIVGKDAKKHGYAYRICSNS